VKLWRQYQTFLDHQKLFCQPCAELDQKKPHADEPRNQIGWLVAAVPDAPLLPDGGLPDGATFWGYTSMPQASVNWWNSMPDAQRRARKDKR
jgi:hypothetical protein